MIRLWLCCVVLFIFGCQKGPGATSAYVIKDGEAINDETYIRVPQNLLSEEFIKATGFNRDHKNDDEFAFGYLKSSGRKKLSDGELGQIVTLDSRYEFNDFDTKSLQLLEDDDEIFDVANLPELKQGYHDYEALTAELEAQSKSYPSLTFLDSAGKSVEGRELWLLKISDNAVDDEDEPKLLFIANMHGNEVVGRELMLYLINKLLTEYGHDKKITDLVNNAQIYIMPSMNPDGFEVGHRRNHDGYDLNRSFPDFISDQGDRRQKRPPEVRAIMNLHDKHHFLLTLNFHGGEVCFNMPWDTIANQYPKDKFPDDPLVSELGRQYTEANALMYKNHTGSFSHGLTYGFEWFEIDGGMQDWTNYYRRSIHSTIELSVNKWPRAKYLQQFWQYNEDALVDYLAKGLRGVHLKVVDRKTNELLKNVTINVESTNRRDMTYETGLIHRPTLPGRQTISVSAPGYQEDSFDLTARVFDGKFEMVHLDKE